MKNGLRADRIEPLRRLASLLPTNLSKQMRACPSPMALSGETKRGSADCLQQAFMANDFAAARLSWYDKQWRARLNREIRTGYWLCRFYQRLSNENIERLFWIAYGANLPQFISDLETLPFDWHGALAVKLLKYLAINAPWRTTRALLTLGRAGGKPG